MRTFTNAAQSPFELKPYAPWLVTFIRTRSTIHYQADPQNHLSFLPPVEVLQSTIASVPGKAKSVFGEGLCALDGQFCQPVSQSTRDDNTSETTGAHTCSEEPQGEAPS